MTEAITYLPGEPPKNPHERATKFNSLPGAKLTPSNAYPFFLSLRPRPCA